MNIITFNRFVSAMPKLDIIQTCSALMALVEGSTSISLTEKQVASVNIDYPLILPKGAKVSLLDRTDSCTVCKQFNCKITVLFLSQIKFTWSGVNSYFRETLDRPKRWQILVVGRNKFLQI